MSTLFNPVGPESSGTYWRRRLIALGAVLVAFGVLFFGILGTWRDKSVVGPDPTLTSVNAGSTVSGPDPSTGQSADLSLPRTCTPAGLSLSLTGPTAISATEPTNFVVTVSVAGDDCVLDLGTQSFVLRVSSGSDPIWSTMHCPVDGLSGMRELVSGANEFQLVWPTRRSAEGCVLSENLLRPGTYVATAELNGVSPDQQVMVLS